MLTTVETQIIEHMARTFHVCAYADASDRGELPEDAASAGPGEDWMDVASDTSDEARIFAAVIAGRVQEINGKSLLFLIRDAAVADGVDPDACYDATDTARPQYSYLSQFGHCLAMMSLGAGVSWFDDHERFPLKTPYVEYYPEFSGTVEP